MGLDYSCKDTKNKANHNMKMAFMMRLLGWITLAKILKIKRITTLAADGFHAVGLDYSCKDTKNKANHNISIHASFSSVVGLLLQRY